jgi:hypothetical protein
VLTAATGRRAPKPPASELVIDEAQGTDSIP